MMKFNLILLILFLSSSCISGKENVKKKLDLAINAKAVPSENKLQENQRKSLKIEELYKFIGFLIMRNKVNCEFPEINLAMKDFGVQSSGPRLLKKKAVEQQLHLTCDVVDNDKKYRYFVAFTITPDRPYVRNFKTVKEFFSKRKITQYVVQRVNLEESSKIEIISELYHHNTQK